MIEWKHWHKLTTAGQESPDQRASPGPSVVCASACCQLRSVPRLISQIELNPESRLFKRGMWLGWVRPTSFPHSGIYGSLQQPSWQAWTASPPTFLSHTAWPRCIPAAWPPVLDIVCGSLAAPWEISTWWLGVNFGYLQSLQVAAIILAQATGQEDFII